MIKLKALTISGFRGIRAPLTIPLYRDGKPLSAIIFGRNGTGKSSITDAWEYLWTGRVEHLAKEGAGEQAYPNRGSGKNETYVSAVFDDALVGELTIRFDVDRITKPQRIGAFDQLPVVIPHPCHIRFSDLTQFVYLSKTQRYDLLAQFMGFTAQVEFQKSLRRVQRQFSEARDKHLLGVRALEKSFQERAKLPYSSVRDLCGAAKPLLIRHGLTDAETLSDLGERVAKMKESVASDPSAARALAVKEAMASIRSVVPTTSLSDALVNFNNCAVPFSERAEELKALALLSLYKSAQHAISAVGATDACPLCGQQYPGDLSEHIASELTLLEALRASYDETAKALGVVRSTAAASGVDTDLLGQSVSKLSDSSLGTSLANLQRIIDEWNRVAAAVLASVPEKAEFLDDATLETARKANADVVRLRQLITDSRKLTHDALSAEAVLLATDATRMALVEDFQILSAAVELFPKYTEACRIDESFLHGAAQLEREIVSFSEKSLADVEARFATISSDVGLFFGILEQSTPGLSAPSLKILYDQERAVVLEVVFHGAAIAPAYKYLSESQLNSFGLAVFLASVRRFNPNFGFVLLDDVVNSLDAYKRPFLIDILKQHFLGWQVIVLTHDTVWRDRLIKQLPGWLRIHFRRHDVGVGPIQEKPIFGIDEVTEHLLADRPRTAGQVLGPLIEADLQEISEAIEAQIKYRRYNDHTLEPLLIAVRTRLESKLGKSHAASLAARSLEEDTGFRNLCAHAKDQDADVSAAEVERARDKWQDLLANVTCVNPKCGGVVRWVDPDFRCACGALVLKKESPAVLPKSGG